MAYIIDDVLAGVRHSRAFFLRHLDGLTPEQWTWKPYSENKSVRETIAHMLANDRLARQNVEGQGTPADYIGFLAAVAEEVAGNTDEELRARLCREHDEFLTFLAERFAGAGLDAEVDVWGGQGKLAERFGHLSSEDYYHAGQVAFIRLATDPGWEYYAHVYDED